MTLCSVILAAGLGKRMHSKLPKVLHTIGGKSLLAHVIETAAQLDSSSPPIVVYGHQGELVRKYFAHLNVTWVEQKEPLGTGHAVKEALPSLLKDSRVLVLSGDVPLIQLDTLKKLIKNPAAHAIGILTAHLLNPEGLGRIIRNDKNEIIDIIEEKDLAKHQATLQEINAGIYLIPEKYLHRFLPQLQNHNAQKEFYLTDLIKIAVKENIPIQSMEPHHPEEILGVNNRLQLACLERFYQRQ